MLIKRIITIFVFFALVSPCALNASSYKSEFRKVTKRGRLFDAKTWDAKMVWHATFFNDNFRRAYALKHAKIHHMGPIESARWIAEQEQVQAKQWDFYITMFAKKDYKSFSMYPDTFWEVFLTTETGEILKPVAVEQVPVTPYEKIMLTHLNKWSKVYKVSFPKVNLGEKHSLTMQSIVGKSTLKWKNKKDHKP